MKLNAMYVKTRFSLIINKNNRKLKIDKKTSINKLGFIFERRILVSVSEFIRRGPNIKVSSAKELIMCNIFGSNSYAKSEVGEPSSHSHHDLNVRCLKNGYRRSFITIRNKHPLGKPISHRNWCFDCEVI